MRTTLTHQPGRAKIATLVVCALLPVVISTGAALLFRLVSYTREEATRMTCQSRMKQLGLGLINFRDTYGCFPPAQITDDKGRPMHSWRVLVLPFMEGMSTYERYDFSEPWDGPNNSRLADRVVGPEGFILQGGGRIFQCPHGAREGSTWTSYVAVVGPGTVWPGSEPFADNSSEAEKILLLEVAHSGIHWMEPRDLTLEQALAGAEPGGGLGPSSLHPCGIGFVTTVDRVGLLRRPLDVQVLKRWLVVGTENNDSHSRDAAPGPHVSQYLACATHRAAYFRRRAQLMLERMGQKPREHTPHFLDALKNENRDLRQAATRALEEINPGALVGAVRE
jgi:hypothetical protein